MPKSRTAPPLTEPTPMPFPEPVSPAHPTATALLAADQVALDAQALQEALAHLQPYLAKAQGRLSAYREIWRDAAPVVKAAQREDLNLLTAQGLPPHTRDRFEMVLRAIAGLGEDIARFEGKVHTLPDLTGARVRRTAWEKAANTWPGVVQGIIAACFMLNEPAEEKRQKLQALQTEHANLVSWALGVAGTPTVMAKESPRSAPLRTELDFDPRRVP